MSVQQSHGLPQIDPSMMASPRQRVSELQRSDINQMSSGQLAKALGVIPEDRDAWNKLVAPRVPLSPRVLRLVRVDKIC